MDILVGSSALNYHGVNYVEAKDIDLIYHDKLLYDKTQTNKRVEALKNEELYHILLPYTKPIDSQLCVPDLDTLYTLKLSHMGHNPYWDKHIYHLNQMWKLGFKVNEDLFNVLYDFWDKFYQDKKRINLNKDIDKFFTVVTPEQHEYHHNWFKFGERPLYEKFLKELNGVAVDEAKFNALSDTDKVNSLWEESMVIAYERKVGLLRGIEWVLCSLSKGFWNRYQVRHLPDTLFTSPNDKEQNNFTLINKDFKTKCRALYMSTL